MSLLLFALFVNLACAGELPIFDMHAHYHEMVHGDVPPQEALKRSKDAGIIGMMLSSWPGDGTPALFHLAPDRVVPGLQVYEEDDYYHPKDRYEWRNNPNVPAIVENSLKKGLLPFKTIGEVHLFYDEEPTPVLKQVAAIAIKNDLFLHIHGHYKTIDRLLQAMGPRLKIIWAHSGLTCGPRCPGGVIIPNSDKTPSPAEIKKMLELYPNLNIELSARDSRSGVPITIKDGPDKGKLPQEWKDLILAHPDRIMLGTDPFNVERWNHLKEIADEMRGWLQDFPEDIAQKVAYENALRLLKHQEGKQRLSNAPSAPKKRHANRS